MKKTINKTFLILLGLFIGASATRIYLNNYAYINNIVAFINVASLLYVCYLIFEDAEKYFDEKQNNITYLGDSIKNKKQDIFKTSSNVMSIILMIIGVFYSLFFADSIANDIIGFIALFLSIESGYLSMSLARCFLKIK